MLSASRIDASQLILPRCFLPTLGALAMPRMKRPPLILSSVDASMASSPGWREWDGTTEVPIVIRVVTVVMSAAMGMTLR